MSGFENYSDLDDDFESIERGSTGGGLRRQLEEVLKENKRLMARLDKRDREQSVTDLLEEKGLDPAIAEIIPADTDAKQWVDKYSHLLGVPQNEPTDEPVAEPEAQLADDSDPAVVAHRQELANEQAARAAMQEAAESGSPAVVQDLLNQMDKITSEGELLKFFEDHGGVVGD